jgi:ornithine cyclodeaminase
MRPTLRFLTQEEVSACGGGDMSIVLAAVEEALACHARGDCVLPQKTVVRWGDVASEVTRGRINAMPGYVGGPFDVAGIKWIGSFPANRNQGLPRGLGVTILNDPQTGLPLALLDGTLISGMRTGAVVGVAAKHLAQSGARSLGLIGAGVINYAAAQAVREVIALDRIDIYDPDAARAADLATRLADRAETTVRDRPQDVVSGFDVIVSATTSKDPILEQGWLEAGALYCQMGGYEATRDAVRDASRVVVDDWHEIHARGTQTLARMAADGEFSRADISAELGEIVVGSAPGRESDAEIIYFSSIGMGIEDLAVASVVLAEAERRGVGQLLQLWEQPFAV